MPIRYAAFMRIRPLEHESGRLVAFEIPVPLLGRRWICNKISQIPGAEIIRSPKSLSWIREESFCEFALGGVTYEILEPFGDNSRYWVAPIDGESHDETLTLIELLSAL
jgi:hypothetical protein